MFGMCRRRWNIGGQCQPIPPEHAAFATKKRKQYVHQTATSMLAAYLLTCFLYTFTTFITCCCCSSCSSSSSSESSGTSDGGSGGGSSSGRESSSSGSGGGSSCFGWGLVPTPGLLMSAATGMVVLPMIMFIALARLPVNGRASSSNHRIH